MSAPLDSVQLHLVRSLDDAIEAKRWAFSRRDGPLCVDTESGGLCPERHRHRLTQLGDKRHGWAFPPEWFGAANEIIRDYPGELGFHNSSYDWRVLQVRDGVQPRWERTHDTLIAGHIKDSVRTAKLKPRAALEVDPRAMAGEEALSAGMSKQGWTWDTVPLGWEPYWCYGAVDPVLTAWMCDRLLPEVTSSFRASYDLERATARLCAGMSTAGMLLDVPFIERKISEITAFYEKGMAWLKNEYFLETVGSNDKVGAVLNAAGVPTMVYTDSGKPAIGKDALKFYAQMFPHAAYLIKTIALCRKASDLVGKYLAKFLLLRDSEDVIHCAIWSSRARTTRMSITDPPMQTYDRDVPVVRGAYIPRPGHVFLTIDADQIEARLAAHISRDPRMIADFRHADETHEKFFILAASRIYGHRITKEDPRYTWTKNACVPLDSLILTRRGWLRHDQVAAGDETVGLNTSTGRSEWTKVTGVHVYPNAAVEEFGNKNRFRLRATPDHRWAVLRDYGGGRQRTSLEMVRQYDLNRHRDSIVLAAPLDGTGTVSLSDQEASVLGWLLSDGTLKVSYTVTRQKKRKVTGEIFQSEKKYAGEIDLLLSGVPHRKTEMSPGYFCWHLRPGWLRGLLSKTGLYQEQLAPEVLACSLSPISRYLVASAMRKADGDPLTKGDTWRTEFYATLIYLSGETPSFRVRDPCGSAWSKSYCWSIRRSRPLMGMQRVTWNTAEDQPVWCVTTDLGTWTMRQGNAIVITGNTYGQIYGGGLEKIAKTAGVPVEQMRPVYQGFQDAYPGVQQLMNRLVNENKRSGRRPKTHTLGGRRLYADRGHEYALLNYMIQGTAAEILKRGIINLDAAGFGPYLRLPVHDEIVIEAPKEYAQEMLDTATRILTDKENFAVGITWSGTILEERWRKV
jgi:DNA polymerase I-like protein with 3'-5' exonuclease and polymerase domains